jgi:hypothetical protein
MKILIPLTLVGVLLTGCTNPSEQVRSVDSRPSIFLKGAPAQAEIFIDNLRVGLAEDYLEKAILLENGTHVVRVMKNGKTLFSEKIFVSGAVTKTLVIPESANQ